jgi:altronate dehydratase small subunit
MAKALQIHHRDNVAVVLSDVKQGEEVLANTEAGVISLKAKNDIPFGHKIALKELEVHVPIIKYGEEIGKAKSLISVGEWIHLHNVYCERGREG